MSTEEILPFKMFSFPKRNYGEVDGSDNFQNCFLERVLSIFAEGCCEDLNQMKEDSDAFLQELRTEFLYGSNNTTKYVTLTRLLKILKTSAQSVRKVLPFQTVNTLRKITDFKMTVDISLIEALFRTVIHAEETYIKILPYCDNSRQISAFGLQEFVTNHYIPMMNEAPERTEYYVAYAVEIIFFLLEARRREVVFVKDLLSSTLLIHLENCINAENKNMEPPNDIFTCAEFRRTLHEFRSLDTDRNGVLTVDELVHFRNNCFNEEFIKRVFEVSLTYDKASLDFKGFVDLVCAVRFRHTRASAKYHFEAIDLKNDGVLDEDEINTWAKLVNNYSPDEPLINAEVVGAELRDMLGADKKIGLEEFVRHKLSSVFTGFVSNYNDLMKYERREQ